MSDQKYNYRLRKAFQSTSLLIEFVSGVDNSSFVSDVFEALKDIQFQVTSNDNPAMDDEIVLNITSTVGQFQFSKDIWDMAFLIPIKNQSGIFEVDEILNRNSRFSKVE